MGPIGVRTLNAIHPAARELHDNSLIESMLTFDHQLQASRKLHDIAVEAPIR
jgi:hypothetical protein